MPGSRKAKMNENTDPPYPNCSYTRTQADSCIIKWQGQYERQVQALVTY